MGYLCTASPLRNTRPCVSDPLAEIPLRGEVLAHLLTPFCLRASGPYRDMRNLNPPPCCAGPQRAEAYAATFGLRITPCMAVRAHQGTTSTPGYEHGYVMYGRCAPGHGAVSVAEVEGISGNLKTWLPSGAAAVLAQLERDQKDGYSTEDRTHGRGFWCWGWWATVEPRCAVLLKAWAHASSKSARFGLQELVGTPLTVPCGSIFSTSGLQQGFARIALVKFISQEASRRR